MLANVLKTSLIAAAIAAGYAQAQTGAYLTSGYGEPVRTAFGQCLRTSDWNEIRALPECDPQLFTMSYSMEVLFEFERAELGAEGRKVLDGLAAKLLALDLERVNATAHADRIGDAAYNERLSERRAKAIRTYLVEKGVPEDVLHFESKGAREPVTAEHCKDMGEENKQNAKLIACLGPDRRVEIEVAGRTKRK